MSSNTILNSAGKERVIWAWFPVTLLTAIFCCVLWGSAHRHNGGRRFFCLWYNGAVQYDTANGGVFPSGQGKDIDSALESVYQWADEQMKNK